MKKKLSKTWYAETYQDTSMNVSIVGEVYVRNPQKQVKPGFTNYQPRDLAVGQSNQI